MNLGNPNDIKSSTLNYTNHQLGRIVIDKEIDEIDARIIENLLADARKSFVEIAQDCNLSVTTIWDRFGKLAKAGIITGSTILVDHRVLGSNMTCSVIVALHKKEIKHVFEYIQKLPFKIGLLYQDPKNRIGLIVGLHHPDDLGKLKESIKRNTFVTDVRIDVWTGIKNLIANVEIGQQGNKKIDIKLFEKHVIEEYDLDDIDHRLIDALILNSMQPFVKLSEQIGISINTVSRRYKKLIDCGVIKSTIQVDVLKLGYCANVSFALSFSSQVDPNDLIKEVLAIKNNYLTIKLNGPYDLIIHVLLRDLNQLLLIQKQIADLPGISRFEMLIYPVFPKWPINGAYISTF